MLAQSRSEAARIDANIVRSDSCGACRIHYGQTRLMNVQRNGGDAQGLQVKGEQGDRPQLPGGPQQIQCTWAWASYDLAGGGGKPIGDAFLRRNNDN
jgi:hypothetical protein